MPEEHADILKRMGEYWEADRDNREDALDDQKFRAGDQWNDKVRKQRETDGRPVLTINRMGQFVKRVSGSLRQSHPSIEPIPVDDKGDPQLVEILAGLIRHIEYQSKAGVAYAYGAECAIGCGIGHWQIGTEFVNGAFDQDICIKRIVDPLSVIWDAKAVQLDRSDADECFVTEWITQRDRKAKYKTGDDTGADIPISHETNSSYSLYWRQDDRIRIASRWWRQPVKKKLGITAEGQVFDLTKLARIAIQSLGITRERDAEDFEVKHQVFDGKDYLTDVQPWAGRYLPIVPVVGEEIAFDGNVIRHGVIRWAKDPQRLYNYWRTAAAEMIALAPKAPFIVPMKQIAGLENFWNRANSANLPYLPYIPIEGMPGVKPERSQPAAPPSAMWQEAEVAQDDMKATTGIYDAALGAKSNEVSGVAINARQGETDTGTFVYFDNFNHAIERTGTILVDLIPKIYDGERTQRIIGEDGKHAFVKLNVSVPSVDGPTLINDLSAGTYDVRIKTGPSYASAKEEAKSELGDLMKQNPGFMQVFGDLYVESLDLPPEVKGKIADRVKRTIPPQILGPDDQVEGGVQPPQADPRDNAMKDISLATADADLSVKRATADNLTLKNEQLAETLGLHPGAESPREMNPVVVGKGGQPRPSMPAQ